LPIHHTTFMALRFVLRPFTLDCALQGVLLSENVDRFFEFVHQKVGKP